MLRSLPLHHLAVGAMVSRSAMLAGSAASDPNADATPTIPDKSPRGDPAPIEAGESDPIRSLGGGPLVGMFRGPPDGGGLAMSVPQHHAQGRARFDHARAGLGRLQSTMFGLRQQNSIRVFSNGKAGSRPSLGWVRPIRVMEFG